MIHIEEDNLLEIVVGVYNNKGSELGTEITAREFGINLGQPAVLEFMAGIGDEYARYIIIKQEDPTS